MKIVTNTVPVRPIEVVGIQNLTEGFWQCHNRGGILRVGKPQPNVSSCDGSTPIRNAPFMILFRNDMIWKPCLNIFEGKESTEYWLSERFTKLESGSITIQW